MRQPYALVSGITIQFSLREVVVRWQRRTVILCLSVVGNMESAGGKNVLDRFICFWDKFQFV